MYYHVFAYKSETDTLVEHRLTESKTEALRYLRESEKSGFDVIRLFIYKVLPKKLQSN